MKHLLLKNPRLKGWEFGMLRAFEQSIVNATGAAEMDVPVYSHSSFFNRMGPSMRLGRYRSLLPKRSLPAEADVLWYVLMGPENYELDLFKDWNTKARFRIVYLYDTLVHQFPLIRSLFSNDTFNICITSFNDAVPHLEQITGRKWYAIEQAVPANLFNCVPEAERNIHFSSYGRRYPDFHKALQEFCSQNNLYYDFTTHDAKHPTAPECDLYKQYAWHISHSVFTVSWPVELTSPERAGNLHPITCRWFEAASAGTIILGKKPGNAIFNKVLYPELVCEIDPFQKKEAIWKSLDRIYSNKSKLLATARQINEQDRERWTWDDRINRILTLLNSR